MNHGRTWAQQGVQHEREGPNGGGAKGPHPDAGAAALQAPALPLASARQAAAAPTLPS